MSSVPEFVIPVIETRRWPEVIQVITDALIRFGVLEIIVMHGWTSSAFADYSEFEQLQWSELSIPVARLPALLIQRQTLGFQLGSDDLFLGCRAPTEFTILCCHEGDLHLETDDPALREHLQQALSIQGTLLGSAVHRAQP